MRSCVRLLAATLVVAVAGSCLAQPQRPRRRPASPAPYGDDRYQPIKVDCAKKLGRIKNLMGVQGGPRPDVPEVTPDLSEAYRKIGVNMVRLPQGNRDVLFLGYIFPDEKADPLDPASYRLEEFDKYAKAVRAIGAEFLWEAQYLLGEKGLFRSEFLRARGAVGIPHRAVVPRDEMKKWTTVCVQVLRHMNDGWANGHHLGVTTVEFINEPFMGPKHLVYDRDDPVRVWECYAAFARAVRAYDPKIKIFAPSLTDIDMRYKRIDLLKSFLDYVVKHNLPLDYFTWHAYLREPQQYADVAKKVGKALDRYGRRLAHVRVANTEWDSRFPPPVHAAHNTTTLIYFQDAPRMDYAIRYRGDARHDHIRGRRSASVLDPQGRPSLTYYAYLALARQRKATPERIAATGNDARAFGVLAGRAGDGSAVSVLVSDMHSAYRGFELRVENMPWREEDEFTVEAYVVDEKRKLEKVWNKSGRGRTFSLRETRHAPYVLWMLLKRT
ncbi:MAG: hypothetical protein GXP25_05380 [Planctomycetes bacterium]|nr:hypothetical protein [Planctomycetota bacterium]